jgi:hypothetical protein
MKALRFAQYGPPSVLSIQEIPLPSLADGDVLVQVQASSINPSDLGAVAGRFHSHLPMTPGRDFAGVVVDGGEWKGKHVWGTGAGFGIVRQGAHAEFVAIPSSWLSEKPEGLGMEQAAVVGVPYLAAWQSLVEVGHLQAKFHQFRSMVPALVRSLMACLVTSVLARMALTELLRCCRLRREHRSIYHNRHRIIANSRNSHIYFSLPPQKILHFTSGREHLSFAQEAEPSQLF